MVNTLMSNKKRSIEGMEGGVDGSEGRRAGKDNGGGGEDNQRFQADYTPIGNGKEEREWAKTT
jgi:hypothetical protein